MMLAPQMARAPHNVQKTYFRQAAGTARVASHWAGDPWPQPFDAGKAAPTWLKPTEAALRRQLQALQRDAFPWMLEVTKHAPQRASIPWGQAFQHFFAGTAEYPTCKKKGRHDRLTCTNAPFTITGQTVPLPK
jgi:putative transposase